jgi:hypothetical protein
MTYESLDAADTSDQASSLEDLNLRVALANQKNRNTVLEPKIVNRRNPKTRKVVPTYVCHFCDEPVPDKHCFCDAVGEHGCRDDWERERQAAIRSGKIR